MPLHVAAYTRNTVRFSSNAHSNMKAVHLPLSSSIMPIWNTWSNTNPRWFDDDRLAKWSPTGNRREQFHHCLPFYVHEPSGGKINHNVRKSLNQAGTNLMLQTLNTGLNYFILVKPPKRLMWSHNKMVVLWSLFYTRDCSFFFNLV